MGAFSKKLENNCKISSNFVMNYREGILIDVISNSNEKEDENNAAVFCK